MAQQNNLSSIPRTHTVKTEKTTTLSCPLIYICVLWNAQYAHIHTHKHTVKKNWQRQSKEKTVYLRLQFQRDTYKPIMAGKTWQQTREAWRRKHIASTLSRYTMNIKWGQDIKPQGQAPRVPFFNFWRFYNIPK